MTITEIAYECVRDCADRGSSSEFTYEAFLLPDGENRFIEDPDYAGEMSSVWGALADACTRLYSAGKTCTTLSDPLEYDHTTGVVSLPSDCVASGVQNVFAELPGGRRINLGFSVYGAKLIADLAGVVGPNATIRVEYRPRVKRFRRSDVQPLDDEGNDPNPDISEWGLTDEMVGSIENYVMGRITLDKDPALALQLMNLAQNQWEELPDGQPGFGQRRITHRG